MKKLEFDVSMRSTFEQLLTYINDVLVPTIEALEKDNQISNQIAWDRLNGLESRIAQLEDLHKVKYQGTIRSIKLPDECIEKSPINEKVDKCAHGALRYNCIACYNKPSPTPSDVSLAEKMHDYWIKHYPYCGPEDYARIAHEHYKQKFDKFVTEYYVTSHADLREELFGKDGE